MAIVTLGKQSLQVPPSGSNEFIRELAEEIQGKLPQLVGRFLDESLEVEVDRLLERKWYVRRHKAKHKETEVRCSKCRSRRSEDFRRNGHYRRRMVTRWGHLEVNIPQVKCKCGGNVAMKYQTVRLRQRIWEDLEVEIQAEYGRGQSYRQIKLKWDEQLKSSMGLRTLNSRVLRLGTATESFSQIEPGAAPPVVRVDGIWITVMFPTGETKVDKLGRKRIVKKAQRIPILAAQAVWPLSGRSHLLAWMRSAGEDADSWQKFLEGLFAAGLTPENGLAMLASDGGVGFRAAYEKVYWNTPLQRCVFHKLRNVARAIRVPSDWDTQTAQQFRTQFLRSAAQIWQAPDETDARRLFSAFCQTWQAQQPRAVNTLSRDFEDTLTFYAVQEQAERRQELWPAYLLRTTSPLERMFREFRRRFHNAILFNSPTGLQAATAQLAARFS